MPYAMHSFESNSSNVPAFLVKLWKLVEDPNCDDLIAWSDSGYSFIIKDQARFAKELLPQYFKHNNMASFIRQLNMYGFKKVMNYEKTGLRNENNEMEFQHGFFIKERSELLELIKRKISNPKVPDPPSKTNAKDILIDLTSIREKQENMDSMLLKMKQENELLWRELTTMRQKHKAQEQIIQKVIQFLVSIVQRSGNQNMGVGVQRKITRMIHDSPKTTSSQVSRTIDVLRNKNSECIIVPEQIVSPLGPVIHEVTDNDHDEANHSPVSVVKSPAVIHVAESPANKNESDGNSKPSFPLVSKSSKTASTANNLNVPVQQLGILEALQQRSPATNKEETNPSESILGIPLEYITDQENAEVANVISIPEDDTVCNVISIPEDDNIGNVISIPEGSTISDIIPISKLSNVISIPDKEAISTIPTTPLSNANDSIFTGSEFFNSPDIAAFSELQPSTSNESSSQGLRSSLSKTDFVDSLLSESLQTPKVITSDDDMCNSARETKTEIIKKEEIEPSATKNPTHEEHNYQITTTESSSNLVKNALTNHLLSVDEKLNYAQDQLASGPWNLDVQNLLGLFSSDELANYDAFTSSLPDDICIKTETNDIMGNEIVQFTPNMLEVEMDIENSPLFEALNQDAEVPSSDFNYQTEPLLDVLKDTVISEDPNFSTNQVTTDDTSQKRKKSSPRTPKNKRRKAK
ncbi:heat shock factor protein 3-like isoform X2 [Argiope bruennichi]|uniref:heat shock factor protein 3-like isoform X2 n=1 Tax=Argiope bruennichi TaxID=94029 RepID=UPI00249400DE|nr:heat shock factor protein 3-like isoform X2 [Argiope bruennichi]